MSDEQPKGGFQQLQQQLAGYIRSYGDSQVPDGVACERLEIYRDLFANNIRNLLATTFPVTSKVLTSPRWRLLTRDFLREHRCDTPYFARISEEFLEYLRGRAGKSVAHQDPPWLYELAHYEWLELAVDLAEDDDGERWPLDHGSEGLDAWLCDGCVRPTLSARAGVYHYPVHMIAPDNATPAEALTTLLVFRDDSDKARFLHTSPFTLALFERLQANALRAPEQQRVANVVLDELLESFGLAEQTAAVAGGHEVLRGWCRLGILRKDRKD